MSILPSDSLTLAILAGGRGSRLGGVDKASLLVGGRTLLQRQLATIGPLAREIIVVANDNRLAGDSRFQIVLDPDPHAGVLPAMLAALDAATSVAVLLLACDLPFVHLAVCENLVQCLEQYDAVVPEVDGRLQPMLAAYSVEPCRAAIRVALERGDRRMISFLDDVNTLRVSEQQLARITNDVSQAFFNVNTPDDLAEAERIYAAARLGYKAPT